MDTIAHSTTAAQDFAGKCTGLDCGTILADPPWQFANRTGKMAPEHKRLNRYQTLTLPDIKEIPVSVACSNQCHLYLWVPNALLREGLDVMAAWGFKYKRILFGIKSEKTVDPMAAALDSIFATRRNWSYLEPGDDFEPAMWGEGRSTS